MSGTGGTPHLDDVVAVEVTIDGMLVIADRLHLMEFPPALGIRPNIPQLELRDIVWEQVGRDLTAQGGAGRIRYSAPGGGGDGRHVESG